MNITSSPSEAGSLRRGVVLLKLLASAGPRGLPLTELATRAALPHPTAHRLLHMLIREGLAVHCRDTRRYRLGPLAFELGVAGSTLYDIRDLCEPPMDRLVEATGDTVYLVVRSGFDAVCMHRREGSYPIRALALEVGSRRPLGAGAGGLAVLAAIDDEERAVIVERLTSGLADAAVDAATLAADCAETRAVGWSVIRNRLTFGISAVGVAFRDGLGQPVGALSVAAMSQRMTAERVASIGRQLKAATRAVEQRLQQSKLQSTRSSGSAM